MSLEIIKNIIIKFDKQILGSILINTYIKIKYYFKIKRIILFTSRQKKYSQSNHDLGKELVISLTSYPPRFKTLPLVLDSIQKQSVKADKIELWIEENDKNFLTENIFKFKNIKIRFCENNLYSYKKIIPAYREECNRYIVTFDDDVIYPRNTLEALLKISKNFPNDVIANRVHKIKVLKQLPDNYDNWSHNYKKDSTLNFLTGVGGVLYPPQCFNKNFFNLKDIEKLSPTNDDIWINWMLKLNKKVIRYSFINTHYELIKLIKGGLYKKNVKQKNNDLQIKLMIKKYGFPFL